MLECKTLATIHDGSPYAEQLVRVAENEFEKLGGEVVAAEAVTPTDVDMRPMLTGVATSSPCVLYYPIFVAASAQITRQVREISGLEETIVVSGPTCMTPGFYEAAGESARGLRFTSVDNTSADALGADYPRMLQAYRDEYGENPTQAYHVNAYDAGAILLMAIEKVAVKDDKGDTYIGRMALRDALFATKGFAGMGGPIECGEHGDCAGFAFAVYQITDPDPLTFNIGTNPEKIYP